jgi:type 1 glutamine amidotransferase
VEANGGDPASELARLLHGLDAALWPVMGERVDEISRNTPVLWIDPQMRAAAKEALEKREATDLARYGVTSDEERKRMAAALPREAPVKPRKSRKLLVLDLCVGYAGHVASRFWVNYAIEEMGKQTGAYEAVFSNDLDNLKYDRIKQFDAVYLNNTVGQLLVDPAVREGLARFVREGGGLGGDHGTSHASMDWTEFGEMLGTFHGIHRENTEQAWVKIDDPASPLTAAFDGREFFYKDEFFRFPNGPYSRDKLHVLLSMDVAHTDMNQGAGCSQPCSRRDNDYALSWIRNYEKGRVFYCALGHQPTLFTTPTLARYFLAGLQFILGDLQADTTPSAREPRKETAEGGGNGR